MSGDSGSDVGAPFGWGRENTRSAILLREGNHRIKNSLQILVSLLASQARRQRSPAARDALTAAAARIRSVAFIHDALQNEMGRGTVDLVAVLRAICQALQSMAGDLAQITVEADRSTVRVPFSLAQPITLAVNELVMNAVRHANLQEGPSTNIRVSVHELFGRLSVIVSDDGKGLSLEYDNGEGYGMQLVRAMVSQIGGQLDIVSGRGARFAISAPAAGVE